MESRHIAVAANITQTDNMWFKYVLIAFFVMELIVAIINAAKKNHADDAVIEVLVNVIICVGFIIGIIHYWGA